MPLKLKTALLALRAKESRTPVNCKASNHGRHGDSTMSYLACVKELEKQTQEPVFGTAVPTFGQFVEYVYWRAVDLKHTTRDLYEGYLKNYCLPLFRDAPLDEISHADIQWLISSCPSESTGKKCRDVMSSVMGCAKDIFRIIPVNPALGKFNYQPKIDGSVQQGVVLKSFEKISEFITAVMNDRPNSDVAKAVCVSLLFGLRPSETLGLDTCYVDLDHNKMAIRNAFTVGRHSPSLETTKTPSSTRELPIYPYAKQVLLQFPELTEGPYIQNRYGRRATPRVIAKKLRCLRERVGLPGVTLESCRHSFATSALKSGMSVADLAAWLGHKDANVTLSRYCRSDYNSLQSASISISGSLFGKPDPVLTANQMAAAQEFLSSLGKSLGALIQQAA